MPLWHLSVQAIMGTLRCTAAPDALHEGLASSQRWHRGGDMDLGIFIPIGNNGWMMSVNSPQYLPSFQLNRAIAEKAEAYGFNFLLSMVKLRGFGGQIEFWDHNLESFTLM